MTRKPAIGARTAPALNAHALYFRRRSLLIWQCAATNSSSSLLGVLLIENIFAYRARSALEKNNILLRPEKTRIRLLRLIAR